MEKLMFHPHGKEFHLNPFSVLGRFREEDPVHQFELKRFGGTYPAWLITRYDDCMAFLKDNRITRDVKNVMSQEQIKMLNVSEDIDFVSDHMLAKDTPDHTRLRSLVHQAFTPRTIENLRGSIEQITEQLLDEMEKENKADIMKSFASPLPFIVISELMGIPKEDRAQFQIWTNAMVDTSESNRELTNQALREFKDYIAKLIQDRRIQPKDDLISKLVHAEENGSKLSEKELYSMLFLLVVAGLETTVNLLGSGTLALLQHKEEFEKLKQYPEMIATAVEELLRYTSPVVMMANRWAIEDFTYKGHSIKRGDMIFIGIGSANRDPNFFENPETLNLNRSPNRHISFGFGIHFCLGAPLARLEGHIAFNALLKRFPDIELAAAPDDIHWRKNVFLRGLENLPVSLSK
ncbi:cytochrome P450 [Bacillus spizizenii]|uniref:Cytochrome P450 of bacillaene metabolism n=1 Tax=Bacillus spizizenii (strain ATCC 23059 / NRRL B-14472 / W23) TaxID=655816 RepID=E0TV47_BACSH|nr:cytochrome P450 [Bacillus spizizenii]QCJ17029.1 cytochrome P450 [Bacillus subtilis]ADM37818.1 cytochrome P450 of bacillaene metabolism [Bacillus spizizenii str. W23]AJW87170.1 cytochrome P450 [Bacillus spizizenii]EFG92816.1 cytochrome P450 of bacillaene metabolism [Bacillus spizizenii ATCC 6633 = JCM 2499]KFK79976.1 cytochrome P450 family protein [Bacillus spizizenii]